MSVAFAGAFLVVIVASTLQCSIGFGGNLIAMPVIVQFAPELVPGSILGAMLIMNALVLARDRQSIEVRPVSSALVGRVIGTGFGVVALTQLSETGVSWVIAIGVLAMVVVAALGVAPERTPINMFGAGTVSGFTASTAGIGGPPVALLFQHAKGPAVRGSMAGYFFLGAFVTLAGLNIAGKFGVDEILAALGLIPAVIIGFVSSGPLLPVVDQGYTRPAILGLSAAAGIVLIVRLLIGS